MFYSQNKQDKFLEENIFKGFKNGFFVDVGAHDGKSINNTLYFEENNSWSGINIEPIKKVYDDLVVNRPNSINLECAVSNNDGDTEFIFNTGYTEMISGIKDTFDQRHWNRLQLENERYGGKTQIITVTTKKLETILFEKNISHINYLSIDVEGGEFEVIKSINFNKVFIDVIGFENNYNDTSIPIVKYLEDRNFVVIPNKSLDIFMINRKSRFFKTNKVIFIGSNAMNEIRFYKNTYNSGIFIEADVNIFLQLKQNLEHINKINDSNYIPINQLITDEDGKKYDFNIFNNNSGSSSIYKSNEEHWAWSNVKQIDTLECYSKKMSTMLKELEWGDKCFDVLIDVQGAELKVLKSFDNYIDNINCIQVECSSKQYYVGQTTVDEVNDYLTDKGFVLLNRLKNTVDDIKKIGQGDLIYARNPNRFSVFKTYQELHSR